jgi:hypothetical protein
MTVVTAETGNMEALEIERRRIVAVTHEILES